MSTNKKLKFMISGPLFWICLAMGMAHAQSMPDQLRKYADSSPEYLEVTEEMFRMIAKEERVEPQIKELMGKLKSVISLGATSATFFDQFTAMDELKGFSVLMKAKNGGQRYTFYKKDLKDYKEYLLLHQEGLIYIQGDIDIKTLAEMGELLELAGEISSM